MTRDPADLLAPAALERLVAEQNRFFTFLLRRTRSRELAEEILQAAFLRGLERGGSLREEESVVAWFYRLLRNALAERARRGAVEGRALDGYARELEGRDEPLESLVCGCVSRMLEAVKPEYAALLRAVDLEGRPVGEVASELAITANNASVRLHRARRALARAVEEACGECCRRGCVDCDCEV